MELVNYSRLGGLPQHLRGRHIGLVFGRENKQGSQKDKRPTELSQQLIIEQLIWIFVSQHS